MCNEKVITIALLVAAASPVRAERQVVDRIAAVIENDIITLRELETRASQFMSKLAEISDADERAKKRQEVLRQVLDIEIDERIVDAEIERSKDRLGVTDKDVDRAIQEVLRMNNLTEEQLQAALYTQGVTWSEYRKRLRTQIERARLIQFKVQGKVQVKDADVKRRCVDRYRSGTKAVKVCASHILKMIPSGATNEEVEKVRARLSELQAELAAGADFAAFALKHSDDTNAPDGDLGCFGRDEMFEEFEKAAFALQPGQVSAVVRTTAGFHIIKVVDRKVPSTGKCEEEDVLNTFRNELHQEELDVQMKAWLKELRSKAFVDIRI